MEFFVDQFVGLCDRDNLVNAVRDLDVGTVQPRLIADNADDGHLVAFGKMSSQPFRFNYSGYSFYRFFGSVWFHYDNHVLIPLS